MESMGSWRRGWDSNPRCPSQGTTVFETAPIDHSGTSPRLGGAQRNGPAADLQRAKGAPAAKAGSAAVMAVAGPGAGRGVCAPALAVSVGTPPGAAHDPGLPS